MKRMTIAAISIAVVAAIVISALTLVVFVPKTQYLRMATTTSTQDSGLLDYILPVFENETNSKVEVIAVGSGQALEM